MFRYHPAKRTIYLLLALFVFLFTVNGCEEGDEEEKPTSTTGGKIQALALQIANSAKSQFQTDFIQIQGTANQLSSADFTDEESAAKLVHLVDGSQERIILAGILSADGEIVSIYPSEHDSLLGRNWNTTEEFTLLSSPENVQTFSEAFSNSDNVNNLYYFNSILEGSDLRGALFVSVQLDTLFTRSERSFLFENEDLTDPSSFIVSTKTSQILFDQDARYQQDYINDEAVFEPGILSFGERILDTEAGPGNASYAAETGPGGGESEGNRYVGWEYMYPILGTTWAVCVTETK